MGHAYESGHTSSMASEHPLAVSTDLRKAAKDQLPHMLDLLERLVTCESPSSDFEANVRCLQLIKPEVEAALGRSVELVEIEGRTHLVAAPVNGAQGAVLLVGHIDTVWPTGTTARWPFSLQGDTVTGPGCFDMKGGLTQMLAAIRIATCPLDRVAVIITSDEEVGSPTSRALIEQLALQSDAALVLEPSQAGAVKIARKGVSMYRIDVHGRASHAGLEPEKGVNALVALAQVVLQVPPMARMDIGTSVTPTIAGAGTTTNTVPAEAYFTVDVRATSVAEQLRVDAELRSIAAPLEGSSIAFEGGPNRPPLEAASSAELFTLSKEVAECIGLADLAGVAVGGGSDGNFTAGVGVQTLDGLGAVGANAHAEGEWLSVSGMVERAALVAGLIESLVSR